MTRKLLIAIVLFVESFGVVVSAHAQDRRLYPVGGGYKSQEGLHRALQFAPRGPDGRVWVAYIGYASRVPENALATYTSQLAIEKIAAEQILPLMEPPTGDQILIDVERLKKANFIVMAGGDQNRLVAALKIPEIAQALRERYEAGVPVMVTSASSAMLGPRMFTGNYRFVPHGYVFETAEGLNWLPRLIVDTHFLKYHLFGDLTESEDFRRAYRFKNEIGREGRVVNVLGQGEVADALALDEDAMVEIVNEQHVTVIGPQQAIAYRKQEDGIRRVSLWKGDQLDLVTWKAVPKDPQSACRWIFAGSEPLVRAPVNYIPPPAGQ